MPKKLILTFFIAFSIFLVSYRAQASELSKDVDWTPPERSGVYDVPGNANLKVRVFVHNPRPAGPALEISPLLICGTSDPNSQAFIPAAGWKLPSTVTYTLNTASVPASVGASNISTIAASSFGVWTDAVNNTVNFSQSASTTRQTRSKFDGLNIIAWGRTQGSALAVTYTWYYTSTGVVAETDTIMNVKFPWFWNAANNTCTDQNSYDAQNILTHELGHWMGLDDTYTSVFINNTMYGYGSKGETKKNTLTTGDIDGVQAIYP